MLIGIGHQARRGKDTAASFLCQSFGFTRFAFADAVREECRAIYGYGTGKAILQWHGVKRREEDGEDYWLRQVEAKVKGCTMAVISDVRFPNEAEWIREQGGILWKVYGPPHGDVAGRDPRHISEMALADYTGWDRCFLNDRTPEDLRDMVVKGAQDAALRAVFGL